MPGAFTSGLMWTVYSDMEKTFLDFLEYVPFTSEHSKVYSYKLLQLILQIGGYIDTSFKEMATSTSFNNNKKCQTIRKKATKGESVTINLARETFEPIYHLSSRVINVKSPEYLARVVVERWRPFKEFKSNKSPKWWKVYNEVKHDWLTNLKKANILNTISALGAAFVLNVVHKPSILTLANWGVVKSGIGESQTVRRGHLEKILEGKRPLVETRPVVDTPLFLWVLTSRHDIWNRVQKTLS